MAQWCPRCGAEYVEGWGTCSNCGIELADEPPKRRRSEPDWDPEDAIFIEPKRARSYDDPFVAIWEGPTPEGDTLAGRLQEAHVPVERGDALEVGHTRLQVPRSYIDEAFDILDASDPYAFDKPFASGNGEDPWQEEIGWSPAMRTLFVVVAIGLVIAMILASRW